MSGTRQLSVGLAIMGAGIAALAVGTIVDSHDLVIGLILSLLVPLSGCVCGAVLALIGLVRQQAAGNGSTVIRRIIGGVVLVGVGAGAGLAALGTLSQLPDWFAGLNGAYRPPPFLATVLPSAVGLLVGVALGSLIALAWWMAEGRHERSATAGMRPR